MLKSGHGLLSLNLRFCGEFEATGSESTWCSASRSDAWSLDASKRSVVAKISDPSFESGYQKLYQKLLGLSSLQFPPRKATRIYTSALFLPPALPLLAVVQNGPLPPPLLLEEGWCETPASCFLLSFSAHTNL